MTWSRVKDLFHRALEIPAQERTGWLRHEAGADDTVIAEVQSLLDSHEHSGQFLYPVSAGQKVAALAAGGTQTGDRIGAYRLVEMIGTGGMGDVYKAVRDDDQYQAEVAIKLMRADVRNPLAEQRFRTERQILAQLDHRNIARLLDGGTTPNGLPYVVMELVTGQPIDQYCDEKQLDVRARVQLFLQVCAAVSVAHQHLVVHRDLKPGNIFVTADGSVKLLDFGIAKLLEPDPLTGTAGEETRTQFRAMTLEYASPEQVSGGTVTTVSDVYSLGVVLYRMLTGASPYRSTGGDAARLAEILGDTTPTRPSQATTRERHAIDTDLDNVLLMALRKEPARRYSSVDQLANDLRNFLAGNPVAARRGTVIYRFGKFARRNKVPIAAAFLVVASLAGGLAFALREARIANEQRVIALRHFESVRKLASKLFDFDREIELLPGSLKAREMLVKTSVEYLDALSKESAGDLALQEELGVAYRLVGDIQGSQFSGNIGDTKGAIANYTRSIELLEGVYKADPKNLRAGIQLANAYAQRGYTLSSAQGRDVAAEATKDLVALAEAVKDGNETDQKRTNFLQHVYWIRADVTNDSDPAASMAIADKIVANAEAFAQAHPDDPGALVTLASAYANTSLLPDARKSGKENLPRMESLLHKAIAVEEKLISMDPAAPNYRLMLAQAQYILADAICTEGDCATVADLFRKASPSLVTYADGGRNAHGQLIRLSNDSGLAWAMFKSGQVAEAERRLLAVDRDLERIPNAEDDPEVIYAQAKVDCRLGALHVARRDWAQAKPLLESGLAGFRKADASPDTNMDACVAALDQVAASSAR